MIRETHDRAWLRTRAFGMLLGATGMLLAGVSALPSAAGAAGSTGLKIGLLMDFSGSADASRDRRRAFELAIGHVNAGGGALGRPVAFVVGDTAADPETRCPSRSR